MNDRKCLNCSDQLTGRTNQKFCSDQCRSTFNNRQYVEANIVIKSVNRILKSNYLILTALNSDGKTVTTKGDLQKKGYRFDYYTYTCMTRNNRVNYFCYDHGFREQEKNRLMLVRRDLEGDRAN
jgi:hypothetical protein